MLKQLVLFSLLVTVSACSARLEPRPALSELKGIADVMSVKVNWARSVSVSMFENNAANQLAVSGKHFYVTDGIQSLQKRALNDARPVWEADIGGVMNGAILLDKQSVYAVSDNADFVKLDREHGTQVWRTRVSTESLVAPVLARGIILVQTVDGKIAAFREENGEQIWVYSRTLPKLSLRGTAQPVVAGDVVIAGLASGRLVALSLFDGKLVWESTVAVPKGRSSLERMVDIDGNMLLHDGIVYVSAYQGRVAAMSVDSGRLIWARELSSAKGLVFSADKSMVYLTDAEGNLWSLDRESGATIWRQDALKGRLSTRPSVHGTHLVVGDRQDNLFWINQQDGVLSGHLHYYDMMEAGKLWHTVDVLDLGLEALDSFPEPRGIASASTLGQTAVVAYRNGVVASISLLN